MFNREHWRIQGERVGAPPLGNLGSATREAEWDKIYILGSETSPGGSLGPQKHCMALSHMANLKLK